MAQSETVTLRHPPYTYLHLRLIEPNFATGNTDTLTFVTAIHTALTRFLGIHGSAISFDVLKESRRDMWIRTASEDASAILAALTQWSGRKGEVLRVVGKGTWLGALVGGQDGDEDALWDTGRG